MLFRSSTPNIPSFSVPGTAAKIFVAAAQFQPLDPVVTSVTPAHDTANVATGSTVVLRFSKPMNTNSVTAAFNLGVTGTFTCTSILAVTVFRRSFGWSRKAALGGFGLLAAITAWWAHRPEDTPEGTEVRVSAPVYSLRGAVLDETGPDGRWRLRVEAERAAEAARSAGQTVLAAQIESRAALYESQRPFRQ